MRWFQRTGRDAREAADARSLRDIEAAKRIREICASAGPSAEMLAGDRTDDAETAAETERYKAAKKSALELALQISDDSVRDVSVWQILDLCVKANDLTTARILLRGIQSEQIRAELAADNPALLDRGGAG
jgi:vacuolar-type H+-ATPase subunit H